MSSPTPTPAPHVSTPFEWLAGELFPFAKSDKAARIDSCSDVSLLLVEMDSTLRHLSLSKERCVSDAASPFGKNERKSGSVCSGERSSNANGVDKEGIELLAARLSRLRFLLYEERRSSSRDDACRISNPSIAGVTVQVLTDSMEMKHFVPCLLSHLSDLPFESRKDVASIFNYLLVCGLDGVDATLYQPFMKHFGRYIEDNFDEVLTPIIGGHSCGKPGHSAPDVALHCGSMLRSTLRHENLYRQLVSTTDRVVKYVFPFLDDFVHSPNFDIATDATESLRLILTGGDSTGDEESQITMMELASEFLARDYDALWEERFNLKLLSSEKSNYMTRRMALQILSTVLLTRSNYTVMMRYISSKSNLILVMNLLRSKSPHITLDAFHVFKIFVANPNKPPDIVKILVDNKLKLCRYLGSLHKERAMTDSQFRDEKALVIATLEALQQTP